MTTRGEHRHRVTLDEPGPPVSDGQGGFTEGWAPLDPPDWYCAIQAATTRDLERVTAGTVQTTATHVVRCDYRPDITNDTRLTFEDRHFEVQSVQNDDERDIRLTLICMEIK